MLAENIYEEDTGGLSLGHAHPELFMSMMEGLGYQRKHFEKIALLPASLAYRRWLDRVSMSRDWVIGTAALTIFVEGSIKDRQEMQHPPKPKSKGEIEEYIQQHPLVQHHGLSPDCMDLIRAHQMVESGHRHDAHTMVLKYAVTSAQQNAVLACLNKSLRLWLRYRDAVARACKLNPA
jgi:pyrroloquinoline-quinone synthase